MRLLLPTLLLCLFSGIALAQEARLAQQYFREGEYEKAAIIYEKLFRKDERNDYYFDRYVESLMALERYSDCEKAIKRQVKKTPDNVNLYVTYGNLFERQVLDQKASEQYQKAIEKLTKDRFSVIRLANAFIRLTKYDYAIATFEKGSKLLRDEMTFAYNLGDLYRRKGDTPKMIENYLNSLESNPSRLNNIKTTFQRVFSTDDYMELKAQLYTRIHKNEDAIHFPELLAWVFIQQKDYKNALRQVRALDRRFRENGARVFDLAGIAANDKDYDTAIAAYEYIVQSKGPSSTYYIESKQGSLNNKRERIVAGFDYTVEQLQDLESEYNSFFG